MSVEAGLRFEHVNGRTEHYYFPEMVGAGVALLDHDGDGDLDVYLVQGGVLGPGGVGGVDRGDGSPIVRDRLFRNDREPGAAPGAPLHFTDVTGASGLDARGYGMGVASGDLDNDGWPDLFLTDFGANELWRNRGDGTFEDVTLTAGIATEYGSGLGIVTADLDRDGWTDVYVANDLRPNVLWMNRGDGTFANEARLAGAAFNMEGKPEASMGVDAGDVDNDGDDDLFMTHLRNETNTLHRNDGRARFTDHSTRAGVGATSLPFTGFGTVLTDWDLDGWLDLVVGNGAVFIHETQALAGDPHPFRERNQLFRNRGDGSFEEVPPERAGPGFALLEVTRGAAVGDLDDDGDPDVVFVNNGGPVRLMPNRTDPAPSRWLGLRLLGPAGHPGAAACPGDDDREGPVAAAPLRPPSADAAPPTRASSCPRTRQGSRRWARRSASSTPRSAPPWTAPSRPGPSTARRSRRPSAASGCGSTSTRVPPWPSRPTGPPRPRTRGATPDGPSTSAACSRGKGASTRPGRRSPAPRRPDRITCRRCSSWPSWSGRPGGRPRPPPGSSAPSRAPPARPPC